MSWAYLLPLYLGAAAVFQGGMNRAIAKQWGLSGAVFLNNIMFMTMGLSLYLLTRAAPQAVPAIFRDKGSFTNFSFWYFFPGILGFTLVTGVPLAIQKIGALKVFVGLIAAQLVVSIFWDLFFENIPISSPRLIGALLAFLGAGLVTFKS